jgi:GT2 family glycosyltransferase
MTDHNSVSTTGPPNISGIGIVAIGRNEGQRLIDCLHSLRVWNLPVVYVDSGSTDGSAAAAEALGAKIVNLDLSIPFTAARARNAGLHDLRKSGHAVEYVQFIDGDCVLQPDWLPVAKRFLDQNPEVAIVCGRRREMHPDASVYNWLCDHEWNSPVGEAAFCGGDTLIRVSAFEKTQGFRNSLVAGEEPELCIRLRDSGWKIWRLDHEMTRHDAAISRFSQWWKRCIRSGYGMAQVASLHHKSQHALWIKDCARAIVYGGVLPLILIFGFVQPWLFLAGLLYPVAILRMVSRSVFNDIRSWQFAFFNTLAKIPQFIGILRYAFDSFAGRSRKIIEYK